MRKSKRSEYRQSYNAQAAVDADGSQLVLGVNVSQSASDANELVPTPAAIPASIGKPETVLADTGYANGEAVEAVEKDGTEVLVAIPGVSQRRPHDFRPSTPEKPPREIKSEWMKKMKEKLTSEEGRRKYRKRKHTVEPVFGIIKHGMKFRQFLLRGIDKVRIEWQLLTLACNCRRLHTLSLAARA